MVAARDCAGINMPLLCREAAAAALLRTSRGQAGQLSRYKMS